MNREDMHDHTVALMDRIGEVLRDYDEVNPDLDGKTFLNIIVSSLLNTSAKIFVGAGVDDTEAVEHFRAALSFHARKGG